MAKASVSNCDLDTECVICNEEYTDPKLLPCLHTLCSHCLLSWISTNPKAPCPICRRLIIDVKKTGKGSLASKIASMPPDLATDALVKSKAMLNKQQRCAGCQKTPVEAVCFDCQDFLCQPCLAIHRNFSMSRRHKIGRLAYLTPERLAANQPTYCQVHPDRPGELYCISHSAVICHMCASCDHRACPEIKPFEKRAEELRSELDTMSSTLKAVEAEFDQFLEKVDQQEAENEQQSQRNITQINEDCDRLQRAVEACRRHLKEQESVDAAQTKEQLAEVKSAALLSKRNIQTHRVSLERAQRAMPARFLSSVHAEMTARTSELDLNGTPPVNVNTMSVGHVEVKESALERIENGLKSLTLYKTALPLKDDGKSTYCEECRPAGLCLHHALRTAMTPVFEEMAKDVKLSLTRLTAPPSNDPSSYLDPNLDGCLQWELNWNHGNNIELSNNNYTARRTSGSFNGIVLARCAMKRNFIYEVRLDDVREETEREEENETDYIYPEGFLSCGVVTGNPRHLAMPQFPHQSWDRAIVFNDIVMSNNYCYEACSRQLDAKLSNLRPGDRVGFMLGGSNKRLDLCLLVNGELVTSVYNVPRNCFVFFDLSGRYRQLTTILINKADVQ